MIVAIDGPAAAGKGTLARRLAAHFDLAHLDSGSLYRAVAAKLLARGADAHDEAAAVAAAAALEPGDLEVPNLRSEAVGEAASVVAAMPAVRRRLLAFQRDFAHHPPHGKRGAVLDGRDIGTVVLPEADAKLFVTASPEERARRRYEELRERGERAIYRQVLREMRERDARDQARAVAPLKPAQGARVLDTTTREPDAVFEAALVFVASRCGRAPE